MLPDKRLLTQLLAQQSISPCDQGCMSIIQDFLGIKPTYFNRNQTKNAYFSRSDSPELLFVGHTDVVPPGAEEHWQSSPFPTSITNPVIARGIVDMKGAIWAFISALKLHPNANVALLLTSDEEGDGHDGTIFAVECLKKRGITIPWAIVGEPTSHKVIGDYFKHKRRGSYTFKVRLHGKQGHTAYPEHANNPSLNLSTLLQAIKIFQRALPHDHNLEVYSVSSSSHTSNIIPAYIDIGLNFRYFDALYIHKLDSLLKQHTSDITHLPGAQPYSSSPQELKQILINAIHSTTGITPQQIVSGGTSDARFLSSICSEIIEFGLRSSTAHQINESCTFDELITLHSIYSQLLSSLTKLKVFPAKHQNKAIIE